MTETKVSATHNSVQTPSGRISYTEQGRGPVALFVHGVLLNGHLWRHQLEDLSDIRRCIAVDLLAHGDTEITPDQDMSLGLNVALGLVSDECALICDGCTSRLIAAREVSKPLARRR